MNIKVQTITPDTQGLYDADIVAWSERQAHLLRAGRLSELDIEHIAEEIEDVGKSEQRELASRMAMLLAHLLKWQYQAERRGSSWRRTIREQRNEELRNTILRAITHTREGFNASECPLSFTKSQT